MKGLGNSDSFSKPDWKTRCSAVGVRTALDEALGSAERVAPDGNALVIVEPYVFQSPITDCRDKAGAPDAGVVPAEDEGCPEVWPLLIEFHANSHKAANLA